MHLNLSKFIGYSLVFAFKIGLMVVPLCYVQMICMKHTECSPWTLKPENRKNLFVRMERTGERFSECEIWRAEKKKDV